MNLRKLAEGGGKRINLYRKYLADNKEGALEALGPVSMSSRGPVRTQLLQGDEPA